MASFRRIILQNRQRSSSTKNVIGASPESYLDLISNPFNKRQWNYLSLGPSYIRLNQSAIRPKCQQETEIKNQHKDIYSKVENHLTGHPYRIPRNNTIFKQYSDHLLAYFNQIYFSPLSYKDQLISREQAQILGSIRRIIINMNIIIRVTDKGNNFYIGSANEFEKKAQIFFFDTNAFVELSSNPFNEIFDKVVQLLGALHQKGLIRKWQYEQMMPDRTKCELAHLYFNPKTHKDGIPVRPIESTIYAATTKISKFLDKISKFLDKILRPIFDDKCKDTTIIDGASLITELSKYNKKGLLKSTTLFCTFDIRNLYTMLPQEEALDTLMIFLHVHDNVFAYGKKNYKQTTGGAMGSSLTLTLANIFMSAWQKKIVEEQTKTGEFYGRLPFLDVQLTNNNGILSTCVYHKPAAEPYVTPFISDHPRHVFINIIQTSLARAVRYSSTFEAFNYERRQPTPRQSQVALSAALADIDNYPPDDEKQQPDPYKTKSEQKNSNYDEKFFTHFTYEKRFETCKRDIHKVYNNVFKDTPAMYTRQIIGHCIRRQAHDELIYERPNPALLQNTRINKNMPLTIIQKKYYTATATSNIKWKRSW
ncbi:unnamed protein product [Rotaria magnacalcarata]|uniref:Helix-turn-helix domain-containing protein n=2 Tax=Rotaria magnacalcarata TaxID=392030 RepID=A0A815TLP8_9BILA|nr:unnamed protein product [Rotaria magnacalcarata]